MEAFGINISPFFQWLIKTTIQGSVLICLILLIKAVLRHRLLIRWHYYLWLILLVRLALPWSPQSRISIFNLIPQSESQQSTETIIISDDNITSPIERTSYTEQDESSTLQMTNTDTKQANSQVKSEQFSQPVMMESDKAPSVPIGSSPIVTSGFVDILPLLWFIGAVILAGYISLRNIILWRAIKRERQVTDQQILDLLEDCKMQMRIQTVVGVVVTDKVKSPALFGFVRPRLLLPQGILEELKLDELQYIFLHELAHLKRRDIYLGWIVSLLQVLHWFNPLIWFAFRRMRTDQELACDALALSTMSAEETPRYGKTLVNLFERFSQVNYVPSIAGILEDKSQLERRIKMITKFKKNSYHWSPLATILIIVLGCISLPNAISTKASDSSTPQSVVHTTLRMITDQWKRGYASVSADGKYMTELDFNTDNLVVREIATGKKQLLTSGNGYALDSLISPDGQKIAYFWEGPEGVVTGLYIIGTDGQERQLLRQNEYLVPRDWSVDGKRILGILFGEDQNIIVWISTSDGTIDQIKPIGKAYPYKVDLSPDERFIAYDRPQAENTSKRDIFILDIEQNREMCLVQHSANDKLLGWTPDGQSIFFTSDRMGTWDGWLLNVVDGEAEGMPRLVQANIGNVTPIGFAQSGDYYFGRYYGQPAISIYTARINLDIGEVLAESSIMRYAVHQPRWSPDGRYLAYCSRIEEDSQIIHIRDIETGKERVLDPNLPPFDWLCWCPDSQSLLATSFKKTPNLLYRVDAQTGQRQVLLSSENVELCGAELSPDEKSLFYLQGPEGKSLIGKILAKDLQTDRVREILSFELNYGLPWWSLSPDGLSLAIGLHERECDVLKTVSIETGQTKELFRSQPYGRIETIAWIPDGDDMLFWLGPRNRLGLNEESGLWQISANGGQTKNLWIPEFWAMDAGGAMNYLDIHPNGQSITFGAVGLISQIWVMENFLPRGEPSEEIETALGTLADSNEDAGAKSNFTKIHVPTKLPMRGSGILSPDGQKLAFIAEGSVWTIPVHGKSSPEISGTPVRITEPMHAWDSTNVSIAWSGNGKWIGFRVAAPKEDKNAEEELYIVSAEGGTPKRLPITWKNWPINVQTLRYAFSPDAETLYFTEGSNIKQTCIYSMSADGSNKQQITEPIARDPAISPDGSKIAYVRIDLGPNDIPMMQEVWIKPLDGDEPVLACKATGRTWLNSPVWSPDGKRIAFLSSGGRGLNQFYQIWIVALSPDGIPGSPTKFDLPAQTSNILAGWTQDNKIGILVPSEQEVALFTVPAAGGKATQLTTEYTCMPVWAPDGRHIYFDGCHGGKRARLEYVASDGGKINRLQLLPENLSPSFPSELEISKDGSKLLFAGFYRYDEPESPDQLFTVPIEGGIVTPVQIDAEKPLYSVLCPKWSPDESRIAFLSGEQINPDLYVLNIFVIPASGGKPKRISNLEDKVSRATIEWSPDGEQITFYGIDNTLRLIPSNGGNSQVLVSNVGDGIPWAGIAWSPDGQQISYTAGGDLHVVSRDGGQSRIIKTDLDARHLKIDWSRDGKRIAFTASRGGEPELFLMENFMPETTKN